jgi:hypothetical protein
MRCARQTTTSKLPFSKARVVEERKQALMADLLEQREAAIKALDDKLAKLGLAAAVQRRQAEMRPSREGGGGNGEADGRQIAF